MKISDSQRRFRAAYELLQTDSPSIQKFEAVRDFIRGINPRADKALEECLKALSKVEKLQKGEVVELTVEHLPENSEEEKRRKKALVFFIKSFKELRGEIERVNGEFAKSEGQDQSFKNYVKTFGKIAAFAKGPFGIVTLAAVLIVGIFVISANRQTDNNSKTNDNVLSAVSQTTASPKPKTQVIMAGDKKIPLTEVIAANGPDCDSAHYHAKNHTAAGATDGTIVSDPGACGFGKVDQTPIVEIE